MKLSVLYATDGRILSIMPSAATGTRDGSELPSPDVAVEPGEGQRAAYFDVDSAWDQRPLAEIHQAFTVVDGANGPYLRPREAAR